MPAPARGARARSLPARGAGLLLPHVRMNVDRGSGSGSGADGARFAGPADPTDLGIAIALRTGGTRADRAGGGATPRCR